MAQSAALGRGSSSSRVHASSATHSVAARGVDCVRLLSSPAHSLSCCSRDNRTGPSTVSRHEMSTVSSCVCPWQGPSILSAVICCCQPTDDTGDAVSPPRRAASRTRLRIAASELLPLSWSGPPRTGRSRRHVDAVMSVLSRTFNKVIATRSRLRWQSLVV